MSESENNLGITAETVKLLGFESDSLLQASVKCGLALGTILKEDATLHDAWKQGRFLRHLATLSESYSTAHSIAKSLGMTSGQELRDVIDTDIEVSDIWEASRVRFKAMAKGEAITRACQGSVAAERIVREFFLDEFLEPGKSADLEAVTINQLVEITGVSRQTIHRWVIRGGLPRNESKTFDLKAFFKWYKKHLQGESTNNDQGRIVSGQTD